MNTLLQVELWQVITLLCGFALSFFSGIFVFGKFLSKQMETRLDDRFLIQEQARAEASTHWDRRFTQLEGDDRAQRDDITKLKLKVSEEYWRREDAIRQEVVINAKLDALSAKLDNMALRGARPQSEKLA